MIEILERSPEFNLENPIPGYKERLTAAGNRVLEIDVWADPAKRDPNNPNTMDPTWLKRQLPRYTSRSKFLREIMRDWSVGDGDIFFPEFMENGGRERYVRPLNFLLKGEPIFRGWDFGRRAPACAWFQYDRKRRRILQLRSVAPSQIGIHNFRDLVMYLSGQLPYSALDPIEARPLLAQIEADPNQWPTPWFRSGETLPFVDFGGWESEQGSDMARVTEESQSVTRKQVLAEKGVYLTQIAASTHRDTLMRRLLANRPDGWPGILIDPSNTLFIESLAGGLVFDTRTPKNPRPNNYKKDGVHDNIYEAATYGYVGVVPLNEDAPSKAFTTFDENRKRIVAAPESYVFHEGKPGQKVGAWGK